MDFRKSNREKVFRYSIRKYHFGAASVAVAALMFFANGAVAASETVTPATTNDVVAGFDGNPDGALQESDEGESKEVVLEQLAEGKITKEIKGQGRSAEGSNQGQTVAAPKTTGVDSSQPESVQESSQVREKRAGSADTIAAKTSSTGVLQPRVLKDSQSDYDPIPLDDDEDDTEQDEQPLNTPVTTAIQPRSRGSRQEVPSGYIAVPSNAYVDGINYFLEDGHAGSPYARGTYVYGSQRSRAYWDGKEFRIPEAKDFIHGIVKKTETGFKWEIDINKGKVGRGPHHYLSNTFWFTLPKNHTVKANSVTISRYDHRTGGTTATSGDAGNGEDQILKALQSADGISDEKQGTVASTGAAAKSGGYGYRTDSLDGLAKEEVNWWVQKGFYYHADKNFPTEVEKKAVSKYSGIKNETEKVYTFSLDGGRDDSYHLTFETTSPDTTFRNLYYALGVKGFRLSGKSVNRLLVNQWYGRAAGEGDQAEKYPAQLEGNGYYQIVQGRIWQPKNNNVSTTPGTSSSLIAKSDGGIDLESYFKNRDKVGDNAESHPTSYNLFKDGVKVENNQEVADTIVNTPGVKSYLVERIFADGSGELVQLNFVVKPKKPSLNTDLEKQAGMIKDITATNGTKGVEMVLYHDGKEVATSIAGDDGNATFKNVVITKGSYTVKSRVSGQSYLTAEGKRTSLLESESSDAKVANYDSSQIRIGFGQSGEGGAASSLETSKYKALYLDSYTGKQLQVLVRVPGGKSIKNIEVTDLEKTGLVQGGVEPEGFLSSTTPLTGTINKTNSGIHQITVTVTTADNTTKTEKLYLYIPFTKPTFATTAESLKGKTTGKPVIKANSGTKGEAANIPDKAKLKTFLVKGGNDVDAVGTGASDNKPKKATGYTILASGDVKADGTVEFTPDKYRQELVGNEELRLVTAVVKEGTDEPVLDYLVSPLSESLKLELPTEASRDFVSPAEKVTVENPSSLNQTEKDKLKKAIEDANPGFKVEITDDGKVQVTRPDGQKEEAAVSDFVKQSGQADSADDSTSPKEIQKPTEKVKVANPNKLTKEELEKITQKVQEKNPGATVNVGQNGDAYVVQPDGTSGLISHKDLLELTEEQKEAAKNRKPLVNPEQKVPVTDPEKLNSSDIEKIKKALQAANPGATVTVDSDGNATVTSQDGSESKFISRDDLVTKVTVQAPQSPTISQDKETLTVTSMVGQDEATKVMLTYTNATGQEKTVGFTKTGSNWNKDDANADSTISIINDENGLGKILIQAETAEAGSTVTVKQQKDGSDFSIAATTKVLGRLEDVSGIAQPDGSVVITVPQEATEFDLTYHNQTSNRSETQHFRKTDQGWSAVAGITASGNSFTLPKSLVKDGTEVAVKASSATKISETKRIKAKFEQPSATTSATHQNGDVEVTLPTDAEKVTLTYKNKQNTNATVTLVKRGNNWSSSTTLPDGISLANGKVTLDYTKVNRNTNITTASTRGNGDVESQANNQNHPIPEHTAPTTKTITKVIGENPTNAELLAAVDVANKASAVLKEGTQYPTTVGNHTLDVVVTYTDQSTENVRVTYVVKPADKTALTQANNDLASEVASQPTTDDKPQSKVDAYTKAKEAADKAVEAAKKVIADDNATPEAVQAELAKVNAAKAALKAAEDAVTTAATTTAKNKLTEDKAKLDEAVSTEGKTPESIQAYEAAKKEAEADVAAAKEAAKAVLAKGDNATAAEVQEAQEKVTEAQGKLDKAKEQLVDKADKTALVVTPVADPAHLTEAEKAKVKEAVSKANPTATNVVVKDNGDVTVTLPDGTTKEIPSTETVEKSKVEVTPVADPAHLTEAEKAKVKEAVSKANPTATNVVVKDNGDVTVTLPDGTTKEIPSTETVEKSKVEVTPVADPAHLTEAEKAKVKEAVSKANPTATNVVVKDNGDVTVTLPDGTTKEIPSTETVEKSKVEVTPVADPAHLTEAEKAKVKEAVSKANPTATNVVVKDNGDVTVTLPDGTTKEIPSTETVEKKSGNNSTDTSNSGNTNNGATTNPAGSNSNSVTPDNRGNTPAPGVTTDNSSNTTLTTPSSTVGQAQASTSTQETPVSTSTPNNSGTTVTPNETRPVDKSELARLVEGLESRLKDLDDIDSTTLESAKALLTEIKQALNDESLTESDLRDIVRRVREVIDSLKGVKEDQQNQEKDQMKDDSQTTTEFSYVVMIGSLLALLGLLLFLIARRKKESELKKLVKELSKLEAELDSTNVDTKVLDQAREALAQAVAFLANEKESDHTEDELIEKLKAILAQLR
ncbi:YSIRK-type signal peptide-containing protein [Streptococcus pseudopneumoniae]|uniref:YSIRK-type signal peptide-containing protein n=1 Tax=Streptococcus pseudopneumoniae TaxID=257758 RepID=UPI00110C27EA|nr:YSIRK-type signal peptide-containing protein [Streptococcus pseudopneumoniae]TMR43406.1 YSIRK-type signal peptide-containing protein [Streptococcus pseudopneumoniae]